MPSFQLLQYVHGSKIGVTNQQNGNSFRQKASNIVQQSQWSWRWTVSFRVIDPGPGNGNGSFPISQTDDQQLVSKTDLGPIHDQPDLLHMPGLTFHPAPCNGFIPGMNIDPRVGQQPAQALGEPA